MAFKVPTLKRRKEDPYCGLPQFDWDDVQVQNEVGKKHDYIFF